MKNIMTTISLTAKNQITMPKVFIDAVGFRPGQLRAVQVGEGIYLSPVPEPTEAELRAVLKLAGTLHAPRQTKKDADDVQDVIEKSRATRKTKSRS